MQFLPIHFKFECAVMWCKITRNTDYLNKILCSRVYVTQETIGELRERIRWILETFSKVQGNGIRWFCVDGPGNTNHHHAAIHPYKKIYEVALHRLSGKVNKKIECTLALLLVCGNLRLKIAVTLEYQAENLSTYFSYYGFVSGVLVLFSAALELSITGIL